MINPKPLLALTCASALMVGCNSSGSNNSNNTSSNPESQSANTAFDKAFPKSTSVFGISLKASANTPDSALLHAANIMAQYLDNDQNGEVDNQAVVNAMVERNATMIIANTVDDIESLTDSIPDSEREGKEIQDLSVDEMSLDNPNGFDASLEEVLHLITHTGYATVYPDVFGEKIGSSIANAMDIARGGQFVSIPAQYPESAWYTYDDETCEYDCMVTEYTYWALTSILGAQNFEGRLAEIGNEWKLNTKDLVKSNDPTVYSILTDAQYKLPDVKPDGKYTAKTFKITKLSTDKDNSSRQFGIFKVSNNDTTVEMDGVIGSNSLKNFQSLLARFPNINLINIVNCDGSTDDEINLQLSQLVHKNTINTHLKEDGLIASGGVDFFLAGIKRSKGKNTRIGVHSWANGLGQSATDFPRGHENHQPYIDYYKAIGFTQKEAEDFYYFTINAATADDIHFMSDAEITQYKILTAK